MKTLIVKIFVVLCCNSFNGSQYEYTVQNLEDPKETGIFYTNQKCSEGDTIKVNFNGFLKK